MTPAAPHLSPAQRPRWARWRSAGCALATAALLWGCGSQPPAPDWQVNAHGAVERATLAELEGQTRVARLEWDRARREAARTADATWVARVALTECAIRQAALDLSPCAAYLPWAADATPAEQAYHRWLTAQPAPDDVPLLPAAHRPWAQALRQAPAADSAPALAAMADPVARLIVASVLWRAQRLGPAGVQVAVDTASTQGWRRPLLAWLTLQLRVAEQAGDAQASAAVRRRLQLLDTAR